MKSKQLFLGTVLIGVAGCTAYELQPLTLNHPANAQAMGAPTMPASKTLARHPGDEVALPIPTAAQESHEGHHPGNEPSSQKTVTGEGKVIATVPNANQIVVEHGEIKGYMDAMTMGYRVEPPSLLESIKPGDQVRFTIDVPNKTIVKIEKTK